jgi:hemin uptake protein HemP
MNDNAPAPTPIEPPERLAERHGAGTSYIRSRELFGHAQEVVIEHNLREYRLRITAQGKLILTA